MESYENLFNWLGFVSFVCITGSIGTLSAWVCEHSYDATKLALGVIAGWDIRVTKTGTNVLRTNLQWAPGLHLKIDTQKLMFDQLEFNFMQWVQCIGRNKVYHN